MAPNASDNSSSMQGSNGSGYESESSEGTLQNDPYDYENDPRYQSAYGDEQDDIGANENEQNRAAHPQMSFSTRRFADDNDPRQQFFVGAQVSKEASKYPLSKHRHESEHKSDGRKEKKGTAKGKAEENHHSAKKPKGGKNGRSQKKDNKGNKSKVKVSESGPA